LSIAACVEIRFEIQPAQMLESGPFKSRYGGRRGVGAGVSLGHHDQCAGSGKRRDYFFDHGGKAKARCHRPQ
jgi:hypothetical protein